jgi:hypothetical protein
MSITNTSTSLGRKAMLKEILTSIPSRHAPHRAQQREARDAVEAVARRELRSQSVKVEAWWGEERAVYVG